MKCHVALFFFFEKKSACGTNPLQLGSRVRSVFPGSCGRYLYVGKMTTSIFSWRFEYLQPHLYDPSELHSMFLLGEKLAKADVLPSIVDTIRQGFTAFRKLNGANQWVQQ